MPKAKTVYQPAQMMTCHRVYWLAIDSGYAATARHSDAVIIAQALRQLGLSFKSDVTDEWVTRTLTFSESMEIHRGKDKGTKGKAAGKAAGNRKR
jgi:hypothetical protein